MKRSIFAIFICCFFFGLSGRANALCDYLPSVITDSDGTWTIDEYCFSSDPEARTYCSSLSNYRMEGPLVDRGVSYYYVYLNPVGSYHLAYCWFGEDVDADSDGDGLPDDQDPCPTNSDCDGDGIPDGQDPCPQNPNPNCTDPDNPPTDPPTDPPDIPDDIIIGPCTVDITNLKAWILSEDSFPFNFIYRIYSITSPLFFMAPEAPVIETAIPLDPLGQYSWIPDTYPIRIDFEFLNPIAVVVRQLEMLGMAYVFALYGLRRYRNFAGAGD